MHAKPPVFFAVSIRVVSARIVGLGHTRELQPPVLKFPGTRIFQHVALIAGS